MVLLLTIGITATSFNSAKNSEVQGASTYGVGNACMAFFATVK
jgi:hypothetical protein